jgi:hypothetical protein
MIISLVVSTSFVHNSKDNIIEECGIDNDSFVNGEVLVYKLYYNWKFMWIPAGEVKFTVREDEDSYHYHALGITYPSYDSFFKVRDYYSSTVDKNTLFPSSFLRNIQEGKYTRYDSILFDQQAQEAISHWGSKRENAQVFNYDLDGCMQDMLSILYYVRNYDFTNYKKGEQLPVKVFFDKETYPLKVTYNGRKDRKIKNNGKWKTMKFTPEVVAGYVFDHDTKMDMWVSDDQNKIPLIIESPVSIGSIKAVLKRHENLKYPITAKIEE